ncbi:hypothetical protein CXF32_08405 [Corynebacterium bovis]|nr:hypothetical protein CXF32_08405 [Corynebacterium bovis]
MSLSWVWVSTPGSALGSAAPGEAGAGVVDDDADVVADVVVVVVELEGAVVEGAVDPSSSEEHAAVASARAAQTAMGRVRRARRVRVGGSVVGRMGVFRSVRGRRRGRPGVDGWWTVLPDWSAGAVHITEREELMGRYKCDCITSGGGGRRGGRGATTCGAGHAEPPPGTAVDGAGRG